jgi:hypothetical protein
MGYWIVIQSNKQISMNDNIVAQLYNTCYVNNVAMYLNWISTFLLNS